ncbi:MAG TPA: glycosyltransferase, partial [Solirubrobacteraceae bacterium]
AACDEAIARAREELAGLEDERARAADEALAAAPAGAGERMEPAPRADRSARPASLEDLRVVADAPLAPPRDTAGLLRAEPGEVDVVVRARGPVEELHACLSALLERTGRPFRLVVDGEEAQEETAAYLDRLAEQEPAVARRGSEGAASPGAHVVLLDSRAVVTRGWLDRLLDAARAEGVGVAGPASGLALPDWLTEDGVAALLARAPGPDAEAVDRLDPFCLCGAGGRAAIATRSYVAGGAPAPADVGERLAPALAGPAAFVERLPRLRVTFVLGGVPRAGSGPVHSVLSEVAALRSSGVEARVAVPPAAWRNAVAAHPDATGALVGYRDEAHAADLVAADDVVVACDVGSVPAVARAAAGGAGVVAARYVHDFEPLYARAGSRRATEAEGSYAAIPGALLYAKSDWLRALLGERLGAPVAKVEPGLDRDVFHAEGRRDAEGPVHVVAQIRPRSPRRAPRETLAVARRLAEAHGDAVRVTTFGCDVADLGRVGGAPTGVRHSGILRRPGVADLLRDADVFLDCSWYQAFGRTSLEAMACGATAVLPRVGGARAFAVDGENAVLADTWDVEATLRAVAALVAEPDRLRALQAAAPAAAAGFSTVRAALSQYTLFCHAAAG